ncbi:hypothetical protein BS47DRAFT_1375413 [Hydnum rufescens UP504]|uniref:Sec39 domain-containing protein n=1 Tax=Hydnum rufescens UP504 TaxID=1448309 RepID=A0A9P6E1D0_9AGAM|nr:hypothetical protein BS47DRAFT_1375413 [Hydnum rufescens UP504]
MADVFDRWDATTDAELSVELVQDYFSQVWDELYIATAAVDRVVDDPSLQRLLLSKGLTSTDSAVERARGGLSTTLLLQEVKAEEVEDKGEGASMLHPVQLSSQDERLVRLLILRAIILRRLDLLDTYEALISDPSWTSEGGVNSFAEAEDDPWAQDLETSQSPPPVPLTLSEFLSFDLLTNALTLASTARFEVPAHSNGTTFCSFVHSHPRAYASVLPSLDQSTNLEKVPAPFSNRSEQDWDFVRIESLLTSIQLSEWYKDRIRRIDSSFGLTDIALELVQHGASQGISDLDELGEDLSLLARLVYDTPGADEQSSETAEWSLERWRSLDESSIVRGYVARSTPDTIAGDIRRLVMPYLYVLEARRERAGKHDPDLPSRYLYEYILSAPLDLCGAIFEASKPTTPSSLRIIRKDEDLARLALASLYGSENLTQWPTMSNIFECLPEWAADNGVDGGAEAETTLSSLSSFVQPSTTRARPAPPSDLFLFFSPLPAPALSRALDILDVHLECGEILARWNVPAPLVWFLQSAQDERQQRARAIRMARSASFGVAGEDVEREKLIDNEGAYTGLLKDMLKLVGSSSSVARGAFRLLGREEVTKIFFSGVLSSGKFNIAKKLLQNPNVKKLDAKTIENLCLTVSREFYDNASSGNLHHGDMKLAYDCLAVPPFTDEVRTEREFIEATSRICSFKVVSRPGIPISPLEIRLVKDRLSLVARVLSENEDAYKYPEVILELVHKLGFPKGDVVSEVKTFAMLADSALQAEDFNVAATSCEQMIALLKMRRPGLEAPSSDGVAAGGSTEGDAVEVCWHACFQLGRQSEFRDVKKKLQLLGYALQLCPPANTLDVLAVWRRIELEDIQTPATAAAHSPPGGGRRFNSLSAQLSEYAATTSPLLMNQGADAAALAAKTFTRVAANFPMSFRGVRGGGTSRSEEDGSIARSTSPDVSSHARQALARGMGWLIGDDE